MKFESLGVDISKEGTLLIGGYISVFVLGYVYHISGNFLLLALSLMQAVFVTAGDVLVKDIVSGLNSRSEISRTKIKQEWSMNNFKSALAILTFLSGPVYILSIVIYLWSGGGDRILIAFALTQIIILLRAVFQAVFS